MDCFQGHTESHWKFWGDSADCKICHTEEQTHCPGELLQVVDDITAHLNTHKTLSLKEVSFLAMTNFNYYLESGGDVKYWSPSEAFDTSTVCDSGPLMSRCLFPLGTCSPALRMAQTLTFASICCPTRDGITA